MFQSNSGNNSRVLARESVDSTIDHRIDIACLAILIVGLFSCLIRSDYNFAIIFFIYFVWQQRKDSLSLKIILGSTIVLIVFDLIFALTEIRVWTSEDPGNGVWQTLRPMHNFGIFCFILILILKIGLIIVTVQGIRSINKAVQSI